jgi:hypothetical protein
MIRDFTVGLMANRNYPRAYERRIDSSLNEGVLLVFQFDSILSDCRASCDHTHFVSETNSLGAPLNFIRGPPRDSVTDIVQRRYGMRLKIALARVSFQGFREKATP